MPTENTQNSSGVPPLTLCAAIGLLALTLLVSVREVVQVDPYFHLSAGEWILAHGFPHTNVFLEFETDHSFVNHEWLYQIFMTLGHRIGGFPLLSIIKNLAVLLTVALLIRIQPAQNHNNALLLGALFVLCSYPRFILRPEFVSLLALTALIFAHESLALARDLKRRKLLLGAMVGLQWFWMGCHGLAILGLAVTGAYALEGLLSQTTSTRGWLRRLHMQPRRRHFPTLALLFGLQLVVCLLNPYGPKALLWFFSKLGQSGQEASRIVELESPFQSLGAWTFEARAFSLLLGMSLLALIPAFMARRLRLSHLCVAAGLNLLAVRYARTLPFGALGLTLVLAGGLRGLALLLKEPQRQRLFQVTGVLTLALTLGAAWFSWTGALHRTALFDLRLGLGAAETFRYDGLFDFWAKNEPSKPYFNSFGSGHVLLYHRQGKSPKPFICGNTDLYSEAYYDEYWACVSGRTGFTKLADKYQLGQAIIDHRTLPGLLLELETASQWRLSYLDHQVAVYQKGPAASPDSSVLQRLAAEVSDQMFGHPLLKPGEATPERNTRALHLAHCLSFMPNLVAREAALKLCQELHKRHPDWVPALYLQARLEQDLGQRKQARDHFNELVTLMAQDARIRVAAGNAALIAQDFKQAREHFLMAKRLGGMDEGANRGLAQTYLASEDLVELRRLLARSTLQDEWKAFFRARASAREKDFGKAIEAYKEAVKIRQDFHPAHYHLGELYYHQKQYRLAEPHLQTCVKLQDTDADSWELLGALQFALDHTKDAILSWRKVILLRPRSPHTWLNLANALYQVEAFEECQKCADELIKLLDGLDSAGAVKLRKSANWLKRKAEAGKRAKQKPPGGQ